jgi:threonine dehydrogenase-like Zn-dependent dehydrogenase
VGGYAGGQAEFVRVPFGEQNLLKLPDSVPDEKGLYLSDVLVTAYHAVKTTVINKGDTVAIWGLGPIGLMAAIYAFRDGASRVIGIDNNWRTEYAKSKVKGLEAINYTELPKGVSVTAKIHEMVKGGVDKSIEAAGGEYAKGWAHWFELKMGAENDTAEIVNEAITSTRKFGRVGVIADYVGCKFPLLHSKLPYPSLLLTFGSHESLQHRIAHGTWYLSDRLWTVSCA